MTNPESPSEPYRVLARKYRPQNFADLIGQEALVRTLTNAIDSGRIAQAYILTGIRGVGKTTTARIIAKALNYKDGPTAGDTSDCDICQAITEDRHPDIMEMDAASRTGVDDIREIIDGVRYAPTEARYKVYIIDEVHMLSKNAFNALLKTLEEPPEKVIFIFATTEIRKVPITILSRCQRFDLKRIDLATLSAHYKKIAELEGAKAEDEALGMIARAADGSVRDGLSLLDQAIARSAGESISAELVRDMLGLADQGMSADLLEQVLSGQLTTALETLEALRNHGADPLVTAQDLLDLTHALTRLKVVPDQAAETLGLNSDLAARLQSLSGSLSMPTLAKAWQMILKALEEVRLAPNPSAALEMVIIRLSYSAGLPDPADLLKQLKDGTIANASGPAVSGTATGPDGGGAAVARIAQVGGATIAGGAPAPQPVSTPETIQDVVALLEERGRFQLASQVRHMLRAVKVAAGRIECAVTANAPASLTHDLGKALKELSCERWLITVINDEAANRTLTIAEQDQKEAQAALEELRAHPLVAEVLEIFPSATIAHLERDPS